MVVDATTTQAITGVADVCDLFGRRRTVARLGCPHSATSTTSTEADRLLRAHMREVLARVGLRFVAILNRERPELLHLPLPAIVSRSWVAAWAGVLREALTATVDAT